jgi:hypothetical protein
MKISLKNHDPLGSYSYIDHVIIGRNDNLIEINAVNVLFTEMEYAKLRASTEWREDMKGIWDWELNFGDHRAISVGLSLDTNRTELEKKMHKRRRLDWSKVKTQREFAELVKDLIGKINFHSLNKDVLNEVECETDLENLSGLLVTAEEILIKKHYRSKFRKLKHKKRKSWWNLILSLLVILRNSAHKNYTRTSNGTYKKIHSRLNKKIKTVSKKRKKFVEWSERQKMIEKYSKSPNLYWKDIKSKRGARIQVDIDPNVLCAKYRENFNTLTQTRESLALELRMRSVIEVYENNVRASNIRYPVLTGTIIDILKALKNNKSPGKSKTCNEMFKYAAEAGVGEILKIIFESMLNGCFCTNNINIGYIITILKDPQGCQKTVDNTRPITISEPISMVLEELVMRDVLRKCKLNKHQFGFRANSSCGHAIFSLKELALDARKNKRNAIALFLDFSKAFDKVNRNKLWYALIKNASPKYWLLLKNYYSKMRTCVVNGEGGYLEPYESKVGVKQGGKLSPFLYNLLVNNMLDLIEGSGLTYKINGLSKGILVYADDTNVICDSICKINAVIKLIERFCSDYDITINSKKTKWMRLTPNYSLTLGEDKVSIAGVEIEEVKEFKFLGVIISSNGSHMPHYKSRRNVYFKGLSEINKLGFNEKDLPTRIKKLLYTSLVRSKLSYGMETCTFKPAEIKSLLGSLEAAQIKKSNNLSKFSKSKTLLYAIGVSPYEVYLLKRKISFLKQLANNEATQELLLAGNHSSLEDIMKYIKIDYLRDIGLGNSGYLDLIRGRCYSKLKDIERIEKEIKGCKIVRSIRFLLNNRTPDNDDTLQFLLDPR